jgi:Fe-S cluster assembly protein SufD
MNLALARTAAEESLGALLPHRRMEEWRWTDLRKLVDRPYPHQVAPAASDADVDRLVASSPFAAIAARRMVFVNGSYDKVRSRLANGAVVPRNLGDDPLLELNRTLARDGARIRLDGTADTPVELVFVTTLGPERSSGVRNVIEIEAGASATIVETHVGDGSYLSSTVSEIVLGAGSRLDRVKVELEQKTSTHLAFAHVTLGAAAIVRDFSLHSGARLARQNGEYNFTGEGADLKVSGAYLIGGRQHVDTRLVVDHRVPRCTSRELFKCVMDQQARGIFQGKVIVRPGAQKTDGKQSSHALLLSETAEFDAKPELEIFADDVICGHGATSGDLDPDHLFYLESRGVPPAEARSLLVQAFVGEAFETVAHDAIREALAAHAENWLATHAGAAA